MSDLQTLLKRASEISFNVGPEDAVKFLRPHFTTYQEDVLFLQVFGDLALEAAELELGLAILTKACQLDPQGELGGEKFLSLGQIIGGADGVEFLNIGLNKLEMELQDITNEDEKNVIIKKLNKGIFSQIDIWMTDLCMEPEAEAKCNELIELSLRLDDKNGETWSVLASIRISQQRRKEAAEACEKSWDYFFEKQHRLENSTMSNDDVAKQIDIELQELVEPLLTLSKLCIELELFELSLEPALAVQELEDTCVESFYLEAFANYLVIKKRQNNIPSSQNIGEIHDTLPPINKSDEESEFELKNLRLALTNGLEKLNYIPDVEIDDLSPLILTMKNMLKECGGKVTRKERQKWDEEDGLDVVDEIDLYPDLAD